MGCTTSMDGSVVTQRREPKEHLYKEDVQIVQHSWKLLQDDIEQVGLTMFQTLFLEHRELMTLFTKLMTREVSGELVFDENLLKIHVKVVMKVMTTVVEKLDQGAELKILLLKIGERHALYGVEPDMIPYMWSAILVAVQRVMGQEFTPKVQHAWAHVFKYLGNKVMEGIQNGIQSGTA